MALQPMNCRCAPDSDINTRATAEPTSRTPVRPHKFALLEIVESADGSGKIYRFHCIWCLYINEQEFEGR